MIQNKHMIKSTYKNVDFSVLMSVYKNDNADDFRGAVESISEKQTVSPTEIVIIIDGPVPDNLKNTIKDLEKEIPYIKAHWLEKNGGLGNAMNIGVNLCSYELIARMDADDISVIDRFEKQIAYMQEHPEVAALGGQISEFIGKEDNIVGYRNVPLNPAECRKYYQDRDPLNHMTVMLRKSAVLDAGNYLPWHLDEDTYLWGRILKKGYEIANLPDVLVNVRVGEAMYARRGGWKYFKSDTGILKWKLDNGLTSKSRFLYNYLVRFTVQVLMPNNVRAWFFKKMLRNQ